MIINRKNNNKFKEIKCSFIGPSGSGKTTIISNILYGSISSKKINLLYKHDHEKISGKTSTIKKEIVGIKSGKLINYKSLQDHIALESDIIINILDYPGETKRLKQIFKGLLGYNNDVIFIVVEYFMLGDDETKKQIEMYYNISKLLNIKSIIIATKIDLISNLNEYPNYYYDLPIIYISNITNKGIDKLINYIENIELKNNKINKIDIQKIISKQNSEENTLLNSMFTVMEIINIPDKGVVFSGNMAIGNYKIGDNIILTNGADCIEAAIKSIHKKYIDSNIIYEGETGSIQLENILTISNNYKRSYITRKPFVTYNNINLVLEKPINTDIIAIDKKYKFYVENMRTTAIIKNISVDTNKTILSLKINPILIPKLQIYGQDIGIIKDDSNNTYCGTICIISTINEKDI